MGFRKRIGEAGGLFLYAALLGALILIAFFQTGCVSVRLTERHYLARADQVLRAYVPKETLQECGYNFNFETEVSRVEEIPGSRVGEYNPLLQVIFYEDGNYKALAHERVHALNWSSGGERVSWRCLDEVSAYLAAAMIIEQEGHARVVKRFKEKERAARRLR